MVEVRLRASVCVMSSVFTSIERQMCACVYVCVSLTFFYQLHKHGVVSAYGQPKAIFISLDYHTPLDKTCHYHIAINIEYGVCHNRLTDSTITHQKLTNICVFFYISHTAAGENELKPINKSN